MKPENNTDFSNYNPEGLKRTVRQVIDAEIKEQMKNGLFTAKKTTDTPTDALSPVNRRYVNLNGVSASRPTSSILGQFYFDTTLGQPIWWDGTSFVDADGNVV